jgi:hypothetical protein
MTPRIEAVRAVDSGGVDNFSLSKTPPERPEERLLDRDDRAETTTRRLIDLEELTADDLAHLSAIRRERDQRQAWERARRISELFDKPALGYYRKRQQ